VNHLSDSISNYRAYIYKIDTLLRARQDFTTAISTHPKLNNITVDIKGDKLYRVTGLRKEKNTIELTGSDAMPFLIETMLIKKYFYVSHCLCYTNGAENEIQADFLHFLEGLYV